MTTKIKYENDNKIYQFNSLNRINNYDKIVHLNCISNGLTLLPELPNSLIEFYCGNNHFSDQFSVLYELPKSLKILSCDNNQLNGLPKLPYSLKYLWCYNNQLQSLNLILGIFKIFRSSPIFKKLNLKNITIEII